MPFYLQIIYLILAGLIVPSIFVGIGQIWVQRIKLAQLEVLVTAINERIDKRDVDIDKRWDANAKANENLANGIDLLNENLLKMAMGLGVKVEK